MSGKIRRKVELLRDSLELAFPCLQWMPRVVIPNPSSLDDLPPNLKQFAEKFRKSLAKAIGVDPEDISEEYVARWIDRWLSALLTPEARKKLGLWWIE